MRAAVARPICLCWQAIIRVWDIPKIEKRHSDDSTESRFSASVHTLAVLAILSNLSPSPFAVRFLRQHEHFFRRES